MALLIAGAKVASDHTMPGSGFSTVQTAAADPTGPGGPTGGPGMDGGQQFQPPQMPSSMPDYQGGNNQPPMDQNSGISIYNTGSPGAQQVPGQQGAQQPQQAQQPAHGTQIPDYQNATQYTQGPGKPNPDYQAPQQNSPQQPQQPSQAPTQTQQPEQPQNKQDDTTQQLDQRQQKCQAALSKLGYTAAKSAPSVIIGGAGRTPIWFEPKLDPVPTPDPGGCTSGCDQPQTSQSDSERLDRLEQQMREMQQQREQEKAEQAKENKQLKDENRQLKCQQSGDFSACPELKRKSRPDACEGRPSNMTPLCNLNPFDTKYCSPGEAAWIAYKYWMTVPLKLSFELPKQIEEYVKGTSEYEQKCLNGNP